jgi:hypothetical protein
MFLDPLNYWFPRSGVGCDAAFSEALQESKVWSVFESEHSDPKFCSLLVFGGLMRYCQA